jgi:hypothetical protein
MNDTVETYEHAGLTVRIEYDEDYASYENGLDWSRVGTMWIRWNRYTLGDMQDDPDTACEECGGNYYTDDNGDEIVCPVCKGSIAEDPVGWIKRQHGARVVLPLSIYEHSGITIRVGSGAFPMDSQGWDSGSAGFIFDTPEGVEQCLGADATDEQIKAAMRQEVELYDDVLTGNVYGFVIASETDDHLDSCWGFVGSDLSYIKAEANDAAEYQAELIAKEAQEVAHWHARDVMTTDD